MNITLNKPLLRFLEDIQEAADQDPDGLSDLLGYNAERLFEHVDNMVNAIKNGKR
jgi:hypothetical protein